MNDRLKVQIGSIIHELESNYNFRIIYMNGNYIVGVLITGYEKKLKIVDFSMNEILEEIDNKTIVISEQNYESFDPDALPEKDKAIYERNKDIVYQISYIYGPCYFDLASRKPKPLIKKLAKKYKISTKSILEIVKKYLMSGLNPYSLTPLKGKIKPKNSNFETKTGRPNSIGNIGIPVNDDIKTIFDEASKYYLSKRKRSYQSTYDWMCATYFTQKIEEKSEEGSVITYKLLPLNQIPTKRQMEYYIRNHTTPKQRTIKQTSSREYRNDNRILVSDNLYNVQGPGDVVEMDEVEMDVSLISEMDPTKVIGRPIVYAMIDIYSRMIIAVSVSLENNSVVGLTNCLINLAEDNNKLCSHFGIELKEGLWDINIIPNKIRSDRGSEYRSKEAKRIFRELGITLDLEPPAMGSMKGQVEQLFHQYHSVQNDLVEGKGLITKRYDSKHHKQAILTLDDIWVFVINQTLAHNMLTMKEYPMTKDMVKKRIHPTPIEIWNYGCQKFGSPRPIVNKKQFEYMVRKSVKARISRKGITWNGLYYTSNDPWIYNKVIKLGNKSDGLDCRLDVRNIGTLWYLHDNIIFEVRLNDLRNGNSDFNGMSLKAYEDFKESKKALIAEKAYNDQAVRVARRMGIEATVQDAEQAVKEIPISSNKTKGIKHNRRIESEENLQNNTISERLSNNLPETKELSISKESKTLQNNSNENTTQPEQRSIEEILEDMTKNYFD